MNPLKITENLFPKEGTIEEKIKFFLNYAVLAPSAHNSQPWSFKISEDKLRVYGNLKRRPLEADQEGRMMFIAVGALLENLKVAANYFGFDINIKYSESLNDFNASDSESDYFFVANVNFAERVGDYSKNKSIFEAVKSRHINRNLYSDKVVSDEILNDLKSINKKNDLEIVLTQDRDTVGQIAEISSDAMKEVMHDKSFRRELAGWLRFNFSFAQDGLFGYNHGLNLLTSFLAPHVLRNVDVSDVEQKKEKSKINNLPVVGVISSQENSPVGWLKTGRLLERILLKSTSIGVDSIIRVASIEVAGARNKLQKLLNLEYTPQMLFGLGYATKKSKPCPRRFLEESIIK